MPWTPLHASLGEPPGDLDFALIQRACAERVAERADLDWKRKLPLRPAAASEPMAKQQQQLELAKDVAAMANSGGGMIVYGVRESSTAGTSEADVIDGVGAIDEDTIRDIRRAAGNLIYPPVVGLELIPLAPESDPDAGVLVLIVPNSGDRPHLVHPSKGSADWFGAPYRHGPHTEWMVERQIAAAYTERETGRRRRAEEFDARFEDFTESLASSHRLHWVVAFAVPDQPHPHPRALSLAKANGIIERAWRSPLSQAIGPAELTREAQTRRGLQRFTRAAKRGSSDGRRSEARPRARVEIHGDGALAVAFTRDGGLDRQRQEPGHVPIKDIETTALDLLALLLSARATLGLNTDYAARLTVSPPTQLFRRSDTTMSGHFLPFEEEHRVLHYRPVDGPIIGTATNSELISSWVDITTDAVNQAGSACRLTVDDIETTLWAE